LHKFRETILKLCLAQAMDIARGGHFEEVPDSYPSGAWFIYGDETCDYECMMIEYLYWGIGTYLGYFDDDEICDDLSNEWKICSRSKSWKITNHAFHYHF